MAITPEKSLKIRIRYGDVFVKQKQEYSGDEPVFQTFEGRLRIDGNITRSAGATLQIRGNPSYSRSGVKGNSFANVKDADRLTGEGLTYLPFDPLVFFRNDPSLTSLKMDMAFSGAIVWEEDNGNQSLRAKTTRYFLDNLQSPLSEYADNLNIPFNYRAFTTSPTSFIKRWISGFSKAVKGFVDDLKSDLSSKVWDGIKLGIQNFLSGDIDEVTGVHLNVLMPVTSSFYKAIIDVRKLLGANDPLKVVFPDSNELLGNIDFNRPEINQGKSVLTRSLVVTYGFVPDSNPLTPSATDSYVKPMGSPTSLQLRGGFNGPFNEQIWTCDLPEITATLL